ncbi:MAG: SOS response-associated peptidase family protein [Pseudomonadota bacterium]
MCGRLAQTRSVRTYSDSLGLPVRDDFEDLDNPTGNFNAGPGVRHWTLRRGDDAVALPERLAWQWLSSWAKEKGMKPAINAKLEKLLGG